MIYPRISRGDLARLCVVASISLFGATASANTLALGDSIALGTGRAMHVQTVARVGASSCAIVRFTPRGHFDRVVISAGVNDAPGRCLSKVLDTVDAEEVVFILPPGINSARAAIGKLARDTGHKTVSYVPGRDGLHPRSYPAVAAAVARAW